MVEAEKLTTNGAPPVEKIKAVKTEQPERKVSRH